MISYLNFDVPNFIQENVSYTFKFQPENAYIPKKLREIFEDFSFVPRTRNYLRKGKKVNSASPDIGSVPTQLKLFTLKAAITTAADDIYI